MDKQPKQSVMSQKSSTKKNLWNEKKIINFSMSIVQLGERRRITSSR